MQQQVHCSLSDLIAQTPFQLGFYPTDSVVVIPLKANPLGSRVMAWARCDVEPFAHRARYVHDFARLMVYHRASAAFVLAYGDEDAEAQAQAQALALDAAGVPVEAVAVCTDQQWRHLDEQEWHALDAATAQGVAEIVARGRSPLPSRAAKIDGFARLDSPPPYAQALESRAVFSAVNAARAWASILDPQGEDVAELDPVVLATAVHALEEGEFRDLLLAVLADFGPVDHNRYGALVTTPLIDLGSNHDESVYGRLLTLCRITPDTAAASLCAVTAAVAWVVDGTAIAQEAVGRALVCDPTNNLALLLEETLNRMWNPEELRKRLHAAARKRE